MHRILVVDVDPERLFQFKHFLEEHGYSVMTATGGHSAMDLLYATPVDLVVTEVSLPDFDGYDLASYIGVVRAELPVVALTDERDLIEGIFDKILHKSTSDRELLQCLVKLLGPTPLVVGGPDSVSFSTRSEQTSH